MAILELSDWAAHYLSNHFDAIIFPFSHPLNGLVVA